MDTSIIQIPGVGWEVGLLQISSDGDDQRFFAALKFLILGFFWVGNFGKYCIFLGGLISVGIYLPGIHNNLRVRGNARRSWPRSSRVISFNLFLKFVRLENWCGILWGLIFFPEFLLEALGIFLGFELIAPVRSSPSLEIWSSPLGYRYFVLFPQLKCLLKRFDCTLFTCTSF